MKKAITNQLKELAEQLPVKWEHQEPMKKRISGKVLNLTCKGKQFEDNALYEYEVPVLLQVDHYTRLKDGVKRFGLGFIMDYTKQVLN